MRIEELKRKVNCDIPGCKISATVKIIKQGFFNDGLYLCDDCVHEIYKLLSSRLVPKSPENMLNKKIEKRGRK